jgi:hypothetical protein
MSSGHTLGRVATWLGLRPTPLRRAIDRVEIAARWLAIILVSASLVLAPLWISVASNLLTPSAADTQGQHYTTKATLLRDAQVPWTPVAEQPRWQYAFAEWQTRNGRRLHGSVLVPATAHEGESVRVVLNSHGRPVTGFVSASDMAVFSVGTGVLVALVGVSTGCLLLTVTRQLLQPSRQRYWDEAWMAFNQEHIPKL